MDEIKAWNSYWGWVDVVGFRFAGDVEMARIVANDGTEDEVPCSELS